MNRKDLIKNIRSKLKDNKVTIGAWQQIPHPSISEILSKSGYDWVVIDLEHGSCSTHQLPNLFRAIELGGALPLTRIAAPIPKYCKDALDAGSGGVIVPMIDHPDQLHQIKNAICWPPYGNRGVGFSRANLYGKFFDEYREEAKSPLLIAQIEHIKGVKNLEKILQVQGLDGIMVGPYDLSASMNITADFENKDFIQILNKILTICKEYNVPCGFHLVIPSKKSLDALIEKGYQFIAYGTDGIFLANNSTFK